MITGIGATGTSQATAYNMTSIQQFLQVSTCSSTNYGINLPSSFNSGNVYYIRNDGAYNLSIYPGTTGGTIDSLSAAVAFIIAPGAQCAFLCTSNNFSSNSVYYSFGYMGPKPAKAITTTFTVPQADNGCTYLVNPGTASYTITLPSPAIPGLQYVAILSAASDATHTVTIASPSTHTIQVHLFNLETT